MPFKKWREDLGFSVFDVSEIFNISTSTVIHLEKEFKPKGITKKKLLKGVKDNCFTDFPKMVA